MARYTNSHFGEVKGKVGNLVGSSWRGIPYVKSKGKKTWKKPSEELKSTRSSFKFINEWLIPVHSMVMIGFKNYHPQKSGRNSAHSYNSTRALIETEKGFDIDYSKFLFSYGNLPGCKGASARITEDSKVEISWSTETPKNARKSDIMMYIVFFPDGNLVLCDEDAASRKEGKIEMPLIPSHRSERMEIHIAFKSALSDEVSMSKYVGSLNVKEVVPEVVETSNLCKPAALPDLFFSKRPK
ncbi:DUF6266 family protein [Desertivirga arenae]|uniref:DUF6266 family protein n=1 Tax=Desertivirga arenae TaxID=2810309 RepID=UPI001A957D49|nr:DUF6266 family protein [Pedobacter sp. SYSU D00823]